MLLRPAVAPGCRARLLRPAESAVLPGLPCQFLPPVIVSSSRGMRRGERRPPDKVLISMY